MKYSVIIPAYRAGAYLAEAVTSVITQDGFEPEDAEIIVIDDGSDDNTAEIAEKLDTILYVNDHKGAAAARNTGITNAKGDFILLLDADDILGPGALKALSEPFAEDPKLCGCFSKAQEFLSPELTEEQKKGLIVKSEPYGGTLPGCSFLKREVFEKTGLFDEGLHGGETVDWMIRFRNLGFPVKEIDNVTLLRRIHANNTGRLHRGKELANYAKILRRSMAQRKAENKQAENKAEVKQSITIKKPYIETEEDWSYLKAPVVFPDREETVFFAVKKEYEDCLCTELGDAFVAAAFQWCMRENLNIICEVPVSRSILHSLRHRLILEMAIDSKTYRQIDITAEPSDLVFENRINVGLCWSAGMDCFYVLKDHMDAPESFKVTHLLNVNAGVNEEPDIDGKFLRAMDKCHRHAEKLGLKDLSMNTNLHLVFPYLYLTVVPARLASAFLALQKGFRTGYVSSSYELRHMRFIDHDSGYCELTVQSSLSNQNVILRAPGVEVSRAEKCRQLIDFKPAQEMLHVCLKEEETNCMRCVKCCNLIASLDAMDSLDKFGKVLDLDYCHSHMDEIWGRIIFASRHGFRQNEPLTILKAHGKVPSQRAYRRAKMMELADKAAMAHEDKLKENLA